MAMTVTILVFAYGGISAEVLPSYMDLMAYVMQQGIRCHFMMIREDALISRSRCRTTAIWLNAGTDVAVMLDHDLSFRAPDIFRLAELAHERKSIVCIPYSKRAFPERHACRSKEDITMGEDKLQEVLFGASGAMAISRVAMDAIHDTCKGLPPENPMRVEFCKDNMADFWSWWQPIILNHEYLSEDYAFCARAKIAGISTFAWTKPILNHWGSYNFHLPTGPVKNTVDSTHQLQPDSEPILDEVKLGGVREGQACQS